MLWSFQSKLLDNRNDTIMAPFLIRGQGEKTLFAPYDDGKDDVGVYIYTSEFTDTIVWTMQAKLFPKNVIARNASYHGDHFGHTLSLTQNTLIVTSPFKVKTKVGKVGAAYLFNGSRNSWTLQQTLVSGDGEEGDRFGISIASNNNTLMIGADGATARKKITVDNAGCVYFFNTTDVSGSAWTQQQRLVPFQSVTGEHFGEKMSLHNNTLIVSSHMSDTDGMNTGAVYVFAYSGSYWSEQQRLTIREAVTRDRLSPQPGMEFGYSVVSGPRFAIIGALENSTTTSDIGKMSVLRAAYVFTSNGIGNASWSLQQRLQLPGDGDNNYGTALALYNQTLLIGSDSGLKGDNILIYSMGHTSAYWSHTQTLVPARGSFNTFYIRNGDIITRDGHSSQLYTSYSNRSCLQILLEEGLYKIRVRRFVDTPFVWEVSYQVEVEVEVYVEETGLWFHGDFATTMTFSYVSYLNTFRLLDVENLMKPLSCRVCTTISVQSWVEMQVAGGDSWLQLFVSQSSFFISDTKGLFLYSAGSVCDSGGKYMCIQTLKDGNYLLRLGSGYGEPLQSSNNAKLVYKPQDTPGAECRFCGHSGKIYQELFFSIISGRCTAIHGGIFNRTSLSLSLSSSSL
eukprot:gene10470-21843_t